MTQKSIPTQRLTTIIVTKKKMIGTATILLDPYRKSAEASITSIASLRDYLPQKTMHAKQRARIEKPMAPHSR